MAIFAEITENECIIKTARQLRNAIYVKFVDNL